MAYLELFNEIHSFLGDNVGKRISRSTKVEYSARIRKAINVALDQMEKHRKRVESLRELSYEIQNLDCEDDDEF